MTQTTYYNCVGVRNELLQPYHPEGIPLNSDNVTTPQDYALLCGYFVKTYPDILNHTSKPEITIKKELLTRKNLVLIKFHWKEPNMNLKRDG